MSENQLDICEQIEKGIGEKISAFRRTKSWLKAAPMAKLLKTVEAFKDKHDAKMSLSMSEYGTNIYVILKDLNGLKDPRLSDALEQLVNSNADFTYNSDDAVSFSRSYTFSWYGPYSEGLYTPSFSVCVTANFRADSETCRRVITGYKVPSVDPEPIYAIVCDEESKEGEAK